MINLSNTQIGTFDIEIDLHGKKDNKPVSITGHVNIGLSVNNKILEMVQPLLEAGLKFESNKLIGKQKVQRELDEVELLRLKVEKARLLKQLRDLEK